MGEAGSLTTAIADEFRQARAELVHQVWTRRQELADLEARLATFDRVLSEYTAVLRARESRMAARTAIAKRCREQVTAMLAEPPVGVA